MPTSKEPSGSRSAVAEPADGGRAEAALRRGDRFQPGGHGRQSTGDQEAGVRGEHRVDVPGRYVPRVPAQRRFGVEAVGHRARETVTRSTTGDARRACGQSTTTTRSGVSRMLCG